MKTPYELKQNIMRRVYGEYALRHVSHPAVRLGALFALLLTLRELTFVSKVLENAFLKENFVETAGYFAYAFANTELAVQLAVVGVVAVFAYMVKDAALVFRPQHFAVH